MRRNGTDHQELWESGKGRGTDQKAGEGRLPGAVQHSTPGDERRARGPARVQSHRSACAVLEPAAETVRKEEDVLSWAKATTEDGRTWSMPSEWRVGHQHEDPGLALASHTHTSSGSMHVTNLNVAPRSVSPGPGHAG